MIGFGARGISLLRSSVLPSCGDEYEVTAVCDVYPDRLEEAANEVEKILGKRPLSTSNSDELLSSGIDAVIITAGWEAHIDLAVAAMKKGVRPGVVLPEHIALTTAGDSSEPMKRPESTA